MAWAPGSRWVGVGPSGGGGGGGGTGTGVITWRSGSGLSGPTVYDLASDAINAINATGGAGILAVDASLAGGPDVVLDAACDGLDIGNLLIRGVLPINGFQPRIVWPTGVTTTGNLDLDNCGAIFDGGVHQLPSSGFAFMRIDGAVEIESAASSSWIEVSPGILGLLMGASCRVINNGNPAFHATGPTFMFSLLSSGAALRNDIFSEVNPGDFEVFVELTDASCEVDFQQGFITTPVSIDIETKYDLIRSNTYEVNGSGVYTVNFDATTIICGANVTGDVIIRLWEIGPYDGEGARIDIKITEDCLYSVLVEGSAGDTIQGASQVQIGYPRGNAVSTLSVEARVGSWEFVRWHVYAGPGTRPERSATTFYIDNDGGSDNTGNGSLTVPFESIAYAAQFAGKQELVEFILARTPNTYDVPEYLQDFSNVLINGVPTAVPGYSVNAVTTAVATTETDLTINDTAVRVADELRGAIFLDTVTNRRWIVMRSDASTAGPVTRLYCVAVMPTITSTYVAPSPGNTWSLLSFPLVNGNFTTVTSSLTLRNVATVGDGWIVEGGTLRFQDSQYLAPGRILAYSGGGCVEFAGSYLGPTSPAAIQGLLLMQSGGSLTFIRGNVIDGAPSGANQYVTVRNDSLLRSKSNVGLRDFAGFRIRGSGLQPYEDNVAFTTEDTWFLDTTGGTVQRMLAVNGGQSVANGGLVMVPPATGQTTSYFINAAFGAKTRAQTAWPGSVSTPFGTNAVNANNGIGSFQRAVHPDGTAILGLFPTRTCDVGVLQPVAATPSGAPLNIQAYAFEHHYCDPSSFAVTVTFPSSPIAGDVIAVSNDTTSTANSITIDGNGANIADPTSPGAYVASVAVSVAGFLFTWRYNGTRWVSA